MPLVVHHRMLCFPRWLHTQPLSISFTGSLGMPVSIMCFKGLSLHYEDIVKLIRHAPETKVIIDHFGFYFQGERR